MSERPAIAVDELVVVRMGQDGPRTILAGVTLEVARGEAVAVVGPSGCGKSTLLAAVAGLEPPDGGGLAIDGDPAAPGPGRVTLMPQADALLPWRTAGENVALAARLAGASRTRSREIAATALGDLGLADHAEQYPHVLSGGMRQRVSLARTLAAGTRTWLLDEPFGALDALTRARLQRELDAVRRTRGASVLLVTHDLDEALLLADRVLIASPRPMRIAAEVRVALTRPTNAATTTDPRFVAAKRALIGALAGAGAPT